MGRSNPKTASPHEEKQQAAISRRIYFNPEDARTLLVFTVTCLQEGPVGKGCHLVVCAVVPVVKHRAMQTYGGL